MRQTLGTFLALAILAAVSWALAYVPSPGWLGVATALGIACVKAGLVAWRFMELREGHATPRVALAASLALVVVFVGLTAADVVTRGPSPATAPAGWSDE